MFVDGSTHHLPSSSNALQPYGVDNFLPDCLTGCKHFVSGLLGQPSSCIDQVHIRSPLRCWIKSNSSLVPKKCSTENVLSFFFPELSDCCCNPMFLFSGVISHVMLLCSQALLLNLIFCDSLSYSRFSWPVYHHVMTNLQCRFVIFVI